MAQLLTLHQLEITLAVAAELDVDSKLVVKRRSAANLVRRLTGKGAQMAKLSQHVPGLLVEPEYLLVDALLPLLNWAGAEIAVSQWRPMADRVHRLCLQEASQPAEPDPNPENHALIDYLVQGHPSSSASSTASESPNADSALVACEPDNHIKRAREEACGKYWRPHKRSTYEAMSETTQVDIWVHRRVAVCSQAMHFSHRPSCCPRRHPMSQWA